MKDYQKSAASTDGVSHNINSQLIRVGIRSNVEEMGKMVNVFATSEYGIV